MTACRWDADAKDYLSDGAPCRHDSYGDPTTHCTAKRSCSQHIGPREQTCGRCIADTRTNLRWIPDLAPLVMVEALGDGVNSEAAMMVGPGADYRTFAARRAIGRAWIYAHIHQSARDWCDDPDNCQRRHFKNDEGKRWHKRGIEHALQELLEDDDEFHPYSVLTRWHLMLAEDYGHPLPDRMTVSDSAAYLDRNLGRLAQDPSQDFPLFRREIRKVREHLESVIHNSTALERGAPCPDCVAGGNVDPASVRLRRQYSHWCEAPACTQQFHFVTDEADKWVCPRNRLHWWTPQGYAEMLRERMGGRSA